MSEHDEAGGGAGAHPHLRARLGEDFAQRLLSGLAMGALAALCTFLGATLFAMLVVVVAMLLSWEWGRLVHGREADMVIAVHAAAAGGAAVLAAFEKFGLGLLLLPIGAILATLLTLGRNSVLSALGVFYAGLPAVSLIWLRSDPELGLVAVVFVITVVVTTAIDGFLTGPVTPGRRRWSRSLPNRPGAGLRGGLLAASIVAASFRFGLRGGSAVWLPAIGARLSLVAQVGELAESAIKRRFGAKAASSLI